MFTNVILTILGFLEGVYSLLTVKVVEATTSTVGTVVLANSASSLADQIRNFVGPLALIACGIMALAFLVRRQMMQVLIFVVIAILVFAIFYAPEMIANLGKDLGNTNKNLKWS